MDTRRRVHAIALCGVLCALSVALLLTGSALQVGTYAAPMLACLLLAPLAEEYGVGAALVVYLGTSLLALLLTPDKELALFYAMVLGYYPALKRALDRLRPKALRWAAKLACFNLAVLAMYALLLGLFASPALQAEFAGYGAGMLAALLAVGDLAFMLLDLALARFVLLYRLRLRPRIKKYL